MSLDTPTTTLTVEIDGVEVQAQPGEMVIQVADRAGQRIPRFCYHQKLSIAANCRMCMVEVDQVPKPLPACATPVADGMKVKTQSKLALEGQRGSMEFLLINHPLDCPICDQGGECELQDVAMGYGSDVSRFTEGKRVVLDKNIGPLIATDMTRCIHCTRCVRFGSEIAGLRELGATGRGEHMEIGTYIEKSVDSELSGNMIDVCPVGALTSKPYRFKARAWELTQKSGIGVHDTLGSNLGFHIRRNQVMRVVPEANEAINEVWLSDRDRYSYEGIQHPNRLHTPLIRTETGLEPASWASALQVAASRLQAVIDTSAPDAVGGLMKANDPIEGLAGMHRLFDALGSSNLDYRLRQTDFRVDQFQGVPYLTTSLDELETAGAALLMGSNVAKEQPLLAHRLRKMVAAGSQLVLLNPVAFDVRCEVLSLVASPLDMINDLACIVKVICEIKSKSFNPELETLISHQTVAPNHRQVAQSLVEAGSPHILMGAVAQSHPDYALLIALATEAAKLSGAKLGYLAGDSNALAAALLREQQPRGLNARQMIETPLKAYILAGAEPGHDADNPAALLSALKAADTVVAFSRYRDPALEACADVIFPISGYAETDGHYVNLMGQWQSVMAAIKPPAEVRSLESASEALTEALQGARDSIDTESVLDRVKQAKTQALRVLSGSLNDPQQLCQTAGSTGGQLQRIGPVSPYATDDLVRHAKSLQQTADALDPSVRLHPDEAERLGMQNDAYVTVIQAGTKVTLPLLMDEAVAEGCVLLPSGTDTSAQLGASMGEISLSRTLL